MWLKSLSSLLVTLILVSQADAGPAADTPALPELGVVKALRFRIPVTIPQSSDPAWQPVEAQLYVSVDRGANWKLNKRVAASQKFFEGVEVGGDGEYWYTVRTADRSGKTRPGESLRILVDTKRPVLKMAAEADKDGQVSVRWETSDLNLNPDSLRIVYRPSPTEPWQAVAIDPQNQNGTPTMQRGELAFWPKPGSSDILIHAEVYDVAGNRDVANAPMKLKQPAGPQPSEVSIRHKPPVEPQRADESASDSGPALTSDTSESKDSSVAVGVNPPVGQKFPPTSESSDAGPTLPTPPSSERPRMVNTKTFELEYDVDSVGSSGIGRVELWGTRDDGKTWSSFAVDDDKCSPLRVTVKEEGVYGFRVVVTNGSGFGGKSPVSGDLPDLLIGVDRTKPTARIVSAEQGVDSESGHLIISWQADDTMLSARPVSLSFSQNRSGPWLPIAAGLENTSRYAWPIDNRTPAKIYLRLEVRDEAGNIGVYESSDSVAIDQSRPTVRIRSVRPVSQRNMPTTRQR